MKKILISLLALGLAGGIAYVGTNAFFNDTETSTGNIFAAGKLDLKIDHLRQTYNDVDCHTCSVNLISDPTNLVVAKDGVPIPTPSPAVYAWVHPVWTAQNDPTLLAAGAKWIWPTNPTTLEDAQQGVKYTFRRTFEWLGPATSSDLWFAVGSDNSVEVWLNGVKIGENLGEFGYLKESMLHIPSADVTNHIVQGNNTLEFIVFNFPRPGEDGSSNPGGLIYKFEINGQCEGDYFKSHCRLWAATDLTGEKFFDFNDIKPGDRGTDVISLDPVDNPAWACMMVNGADLENTLIDPEAKAGDVTPLVGELSHRLNLFVWNDDGDGIHQPAESQVFSGTMDTFMNMPIAQPTGAPLPGGQTKYLGLAWCFGAQTVDPGTGVISCSGAAEDNKTQTDSYIADLIFYAEQSRNNTAFSCQALPTPTPKQIIGI